MNSKNEAMTSLIIGAGVGAAAGYFVAKNGSDGNSSQKVKLELDNALAENEKLRKRNKDITRELEDAQSQLAKLRRQATSLDDSKDDLEDELRDKETEIKRLRQRNSDLALQVKELTESVALLNAELQK